MGEDPENSWTMWGRGYIGRNISEQSIGLVAVPDRDRNTATSSFVRTAQAGIQEKQQTTTTTNRAIIRWYGNLTVGLF